MNGWAKYYAGGGTYIGDDRSVYYAKTASWRKSPLNNIVKVSLSHEKMHLVLEGPGEYWQADEFESVFPGGSRMIRRRIMRRIEPSDHFYCVTSDGWGPEGQQHTIRFRIQRGQGRTFPILRSDIGKWFIMEYDIVNKKWSHRISKGRS